MGLWSEICSQLFVLRGWFTNLYMKLDLDFHIFPRQVMYIEAKRHNITS